MTDRVSDGDFSGLSIVADDGLSKCAVSTSFASPLWKAISRTGGKIGKGISGKFERLARHARMTDGPSLASTALNTFWSIMDPITAYDSYKEFRDGNYLGGLGLALLTAGGLMSQRDAAKGLHRWLNLGKNSALYKTMYSLSDVPEGLAVFGARNKVPVASWFARHPFIGGMALTSGGGWLHGKMNEPYDSSGPRTASRRKGEPYHIDWRA